MSHTLTAVVAVCCVTVIDYLPIPEIAGIALAFVSGAALSFYINDRWFS